MRARVADAVLRNVVGQVGVIGVAVKGELQDLHAREAGAAQQAQHARIHLAEVLGDEGQRAEFARGGGKQLHARAAAPAAVLGRRCARVHLVVAVEAAEVVDADDVVKRKGGADAADPPGVALRLVRAPIVHGVAPQLAGRRKVVGRHPRHAAGGAVFVEFEEVRVGPHVGRVRRDVQRQVADDADAQPVDVGAQVRPLAAELVLQKQPKEVLALVLPQKLLQRGLVAQLVRLFPTVEGSPAVRLFERHEQRVLMELLPLHKAAEVGVARIEPRKGAAQHRVLLVEQKAVVDGPLVPQRAQLAFAQQPLRGEAVDVDQVGVAGRAEHRLVGRIAEARLHQRQHLPIAHARGVQKVGKAAGLCAHRADAVFTGQGRDVQQHPRRTLRYGRSPLLHLVCLHIYNVSLLKNAAENAARRPQKLRCRPRRIAISRGGRPSKICGAGRAILTIVPQVGRAFNIFFENFLHFSEFFCRARHARPPRARTARTALRWTRPLCLPRCPVRRNRLPAAAHALPPPRTPSHRRARPPTAAPPTAWGGGAAVFDFFRNSARKSFDFSAKYAIIVELSRLQTSVSTICT